MRPVEFTLDAIIQAGQDLQTAGRNITGFALRQRVGGGNPTRLKQVWDEHQSSQAATVVEPVAELPVEVAEVVASVGKALSERIAALAIELNDKAVKAADRRVHDVVRSAGEQRAQAERELADASQTVDDLEAQLDAGQVNAQGLQAKLAELQGVNQAQAVELAQLRERLAATEAERTRYQAETENLRGEVAGHKQAALAVTQARDQVHAELVKLQAKAEAAEQSHQEQRKSTALEALRTAERMTQAEAERDSTRREASAAREDAANLRGQIDAMQSQVANLMQALTERSPVGPVEALKTE
jgi:DNA repair exonuclease SbcCD ATPase subunit